MAVVKAFVLCDKVIHDKVDEKHSAIGLFDSIMAPGFPCRHTPFGLILLVTDIEGENKLVVELANIETQRLVARAEYPSINVKDRLEGVNIAIMFPPLEFPSAGRYEFRVFCNGAFVDRRDLQLKQHPSVGG